MKLVIQGKLPTLNEMINASKRNKYTYEKIKNEAMHLVGWSAKAQKIKVNGLADYIITWYCPNKKTDKDNIIAGQKYIFDGLQAVKVIENDGWKQIRSIHHNFEVDKKQPRVEVEIKEVKEEAV